MIPAKAFYLVRHGETEANASQITAGGGLDSPLTEKGRSQARMLAELIHTLAVKPSKIIHSPMIRAKDTAHYINESLQLTMHEIEDLREHQMGAWEGKPWDEIVQDLRSNIRPKDGENKDDFSRRVKQVLTAILETHESPVMIVAHGGTFHAIAQIYGHHKNDWSIQNCHLHYFEPCQDRAAFPWRIWHFDIEEEGTLVKRTAPFCGSHYLEEIR